MSPIIYVGLAGMFGGLFGSRFMSERAYTLLTREEKLALLDGFSEHRKYASLPLIAVVFMFIGLRYVPDEYVRWGVLGIGAFFAAYLAWQGRYVARRLGELKITEPFIKALSRAQWCSRAGWLVFFVCMFVGLSW